jgi:hypothetical protein
VWIDPKDIKLHTTSYQNVGGLYDAVVKLPPKAYSQRVGNKILKMESFIKPTLKKVKKIEETSWHKLIENYSKASSYEASYWYKKLSYELTTTGVARHKNIIMKSDYDIAQFFESYVNGLFSSIARQGIIHNSQIFTECGVIIDHDGSFVKASHGNHRFAIARIAGNRKVPCIVEGISEHFVAHMPFWKLKKRNQEAISIASYIVKGNREQ